MPIIEEAPLISPEIFSETDRAGVLDWLEKYQGHKTAIFYDAIPLKYPEIAWPQSVARHPEYMKMLGTHFDQVLSISNASSRELTTYWDWLNIQDRPQLDAIQLGADLHFQLRNQFAPKVFNPPWQLVMVGILEPRKNILMAIDICERLYREGVHLELHLAGRLNPHFGNPIYDRILEAKKNGFPIHWHKSPEKNFVINLYRKSHLCLFPSKAEGCGLPVLESLWMGTPVLASDIPSVQENASLGAVQLFENNNPESFKLHLQSLLRDPTRLEELTGAAKNAELPTWSQTALQLHSQIPDEEN